MKRMIIFIALILCIGLTYYYFKNIYGWMEFRKNTDTPKEFLNHVKIKREEYSNDSIKIIEQLQDFLMNHKESFYSKEYFDSTDLIIDSIIYNSDYNKIVAFIITRNPIRRQLIPNEQHNWYYDGYCYLGIRQNDTINLIWTGSGYSNFYDKADIAGSLRSFYFRQFVAIKDTSGESKYKYNMNDVRFWNSPIWKEMEDKKQARKDFEEEKKNHPENIYEPKH